MNNNIESKIIQLIIQTGCLEFPINIKRIAQHCKYNIRYYGKSKRLLEKLCLEEYADNHDAFSMMYENNYYIFLSDNLTVDASNKAVAHEIGHIVLNHLDGNRIFGYSEDALLTERYECEAEEFALGLIAPLYILESKKIENPEDIRKLTNLSLADSNTVFINLLNYREKYATALQHRRIGKLCEDNKTKTLNKAFTVIIMAVLLLFTVVIGYFAILFVPVHTDDSKQSENNIISTDESGTETGDISSTESLNPNHVYYWTDSGEVFHSHKDCRSIKNSSEIHSGSLAEAQEEKGRLCKFCESEDK